ncbi:hypothetical protein HB13667_05925 [Pseudomonas putida]|uniref:Uncharacterized protein n=1 Tax=Pseudomonas putida TaxID=303 RepID=A0A0P7DGM7_PSEPU|nr:hypothetical protein [Pseudomonas putida]KPM67582.1 hypothetical protein HB13667_05925 [Pseudomonas putida]
MGALREAQWQYDNAEPDPESHQQEAERVWIDNGVAELMARRDYQFPIHGKLVGVTYERFALAVDEYAMSELGRAEISDSVLGRLMLAAMGKVPCDAKAAAEEIMGCANPQSVLEQLARDLLAPFALPGIQAAAEQAREP